MPFYLSATEITNAQYGRFLKATGYQAPLYWQDQNLNGPNQPVVGSPGTTPWPSAGG